MSKMGQKFEDNLDSAKYEIYEALKELLKWAELSYTDDTGEWADENDPAIIQAKQAIAKVEEL